MRTILGTVSITLFVALLGSTPLLADQHVDGRWVLTVSLGSGQGGDATFELEEEKGKITGTYTGALGEEEVTGSVDGNEVELSFDSQAGTITYRGTIEDGKMSGECNYGQLGSGTFEGTKEETSSDGE